MGGELEVAVTLDDGTGVGTMVRLGAAEVGYTVLDASAVVDGAYVDTADSTELETEATTLDAADETEAAVDEAPPAAEEADTAAQAAWAAVKTAIAWSPQAARTQDVAAAVMADWLDSSHWHAISEAPQLVDEATASEIQVVAQAGI